MPKIIFEDSDKQIKMKQLVVYDKVLHGLGDDGIVYCYSESLVGWLPLDTTIIIAKRTK
jgi:hypothetical protein